LQPTAIKQLNYLLAIDSRYRRGWGVSQHTLDLLMLQNLISPRSGEDIHACLKPLSHGYRVAILAIQTH
jgi:hypothetical protein